MRDPLWIRLLLMLHIAAGITAFVMAPIALLTAKGGPAHRRWGMVYYRAMAVVAITAVIMAAYRPILFLALVAVFSFYASFVAYRVLGQKAAARGERVARPLDWAAAVITFVCCLGLALCGAFRPQWIGNLGIPAIVFGAIGMSISGRAMRRFVRPPEDRMFWWYAHLQGMIASYIAAWTAFSLVTLGRFVHIGWVLWVLPTAIGVPAIIATTAYYKKKFRPRAKVAV